MAGETNLFNSRRRLFWATQPDGCGTVAGCGLDCGSPGLAFDDCFERDDLTCVEFGEDPTTGVVSIGKPIQRTIATNDWVRGLAINMLMTDGRRPDRTCGYNPRGQGGHWSESFDRGPAPGIGSLMLQTDAATSVNETQNLIVAFAQSTLDRLVARGVAQRVDVTGEYLGNNRFQIIADIIGLGNNSARVGVTGERLSNGWVWQ